MSIRIHDYSCGDILSKLAYRRMWSGLQNLSWALEKEGLDPNVDAIYWPEFSITRNRNRWNEGFSYGAFVCWNPTETPFVPISIRPNACGTLIALIPRISYSELLEIIVSWKNSAYFEKSHTKLAPNDLSHRNHFVAFGSSPSFSRNTLAIVHTCPSYLKKPDSTRFGLYPNKTSQLNSIAKIIGDKNAILRYIIGDEANLYLKEFFEAEEISKYSRVGLIESILGQKVKILANETHQGIGSNYFYLGCSLDPTSGIILGNDEGAPSYFITDFLSLKQILRKSDSALRIADVANSRVCPHGLGVAWAFEGTSESIQLSNKTIIIKLTTTSGIEHVYTNPVHIPIRYRSGQIAKKTIDLLEPKQQITIFGDFICKL